MLQQKGGGYVLLMLMLFLPILGVLGLGIATNSLVEYKLSIFYVNKVAAFYQAEEDLLRAEQDFWEGRSIKTAQYKQLYSKHCGVLMYLLTATAKVHGAYSKLCSVVVKSVIASDCLSQPQVMPSRKAFWVVV